MSLCILRNCVGDSIGYRVMAKVRRHLRPPIPGQFSIIHGILVVLHVEGEHSTVIYRLVDKRDFRVITGTRRPRALSRGWLLLRGHSYDQCSEIGPLHLYQYSAPQRPW